MEKNTQKAIQQIKQKKKLEETKKFKDVYYNYYDDVKSHTHQVYDW